jgi:RNA polymerase sigma-70 factor, ECF subfamily
MHRAEEHPRAEELQQFLDEHYQRVVGSVSMITGDRANAEDAVQDAIVKAWRRRDEPIDRLVAWITVVASNHARTGRRREAAKQRATERLAGQISTADQPSVFDEELSAALRGLPVRERQAAVLFYVFDLSVTDVAAAMSVSDGTVKTLLSRARGHLAGALDSSTEISNGGAA